MMDARAAQIPRVSPALITAAGCVAAAVLTYTSIAYAPAQTGDGLSLARALAVVAAAAGLLLLARRPSVVLVLLLAFVYLNVSEILVRNHGWPSLLRLVIVPIGLVALSASTALHRRRVLTHPLALALAAYVLVVFAATTVARDAALATERSFDVIKTFVLVLLVALLAPRLSHVRAAVWTMVVCGTLLAALGVAQVLTGSYASEAAGFARVKYAHIVGTTFEPRISGPLGDPNFFAQSLLVLVPPALVLAMHERRTPLRVAAVVCALIVTAGAIFTYSRGGAVALVCAAAVLIAGSIRHLRARHLAAVAAAIAVVALLTPREFLMRLTTLQQFIGRDAGEQLGDTSFEERRLLTTAAWMTFVDHPLTGVGPGNYTHYFDEYVGRIGSSIIEYEVQDDEHYPHNLYLEIAAETGLPGIVAFTGVLAATFVALRRARAAFRAAGEAFAASIVVALQASSVGYLVSSLFLHGSHQRYLWLLFALTIALSAMTPPRPAPLTEAP